MFDNSPNYWNNEADIDWMDANVPDVTVDGIPLDGHYFDQLMEEIEEI